MRIIVFGGTGRIGSAVAWDLARYGGADGVGIAGRSPDALQKTVAWIGSERVTAHVLDTANAAATRRLMQEYDVGVIALPDRRSSYRTVEAAIDAGLNAVDILEEYHAAPTLTRRKGWRSRRG